MTREEKIKVLAELDGWVHCYVTKYGVCGWLPVEQSGTIHGARGDNLCKIPYLTSYDAIIPLVKKRCAGNALMEQTFINEVERGICSGFHAARTVGFFLMAAEPEQLADALIKAVRKWKD